MTADPISALADDLDAEADRYEAAEPVHWRELAEATRDHATRVRSLRNVTSDEDPR